MSDTYRIRDTGATIRTTGKVYFAQKGGPDGLVKVGWTSQDVNTRLRKFGWPKDVELLGTIDGTHFTEKQVHSYLHEDLAHGEWYKPTKRVLEAATGKPFENVTGNEDPFEKLPPEGAKRISAAGSSMTVGAVHYRRSQILTYYESGASGFDAAEGLLMTVIAITREIRLMARDGWFTAESKVKRRRALKNVAAETPRRQMAA